MSVDLDAIEAAEKAMTAAPWKVVPSNEKANSCRIFGDKYIGVLGGSDDPKNEVEANATGIVTLRNAAPALIARIREQDAEIKRLREACEDYLKWVRTPHHHLPIQETINQRREILERMKAALEQKGGES